MAKFKTGDIILGEHQTYTLQQEIVIGSKVEIWICTTTSSEEFAIKLFINKNEKSALKSPELVTKLEHIGCNYLLVPKAVGYFGDIFYVLMDYCEESLYHQIQKRGAARIQNNPYGGETKELFSKEETIKVINELFDGLNLLHINGLAHLDIKPSNVMVLQKNGESNYAISDFDNIRDLDKTVSRTKLNEDHGISPYYAAPEQLLNKSYYGERCSDIYSAGVTLFETLTGENIPYGGTKVKEELILRESQVKYKLSQLGLDQQLVDIIAKCLAFDKANRPVASEVYGLTKFYIDEKRWPGAESIIGKNITTGGSVIEEIADKPFSKWILATVIVLVLVSTAFVGYSFFITNTSSSADSYGASKVEESTSDDCPIYEITHKKNWSKGIKRMKNTSNGFYALQKIEDKLPFRCGYSKITNLNEKGYAVIYKEEGTGVIDAQGDIFIEIGKLNEKLIEEYYNNDKDFKKLKE